MSTETPTSTPNPSQSSVNQSTNSSTNQSVPPRFSQRPSASQVRGPISWKSVTLMVATVGGLLAYYEYERDRKATAIQPVVSIGRVALGGPFELVDNEGKVFSSKDLLGNYALVYFGFTHCPDICPAELKKMEEALTAYHAKMTDPSVRIQPVFITIDPKRDTPERLANYKQQWSPSFKFLTGTVDQIRDIARKYRVYYSAPEGDTDEDYLVDHSIFFYLLDKNGEVVDYLGKNMTAPEVTARLTQFAQQDSGIKK